ncbi:MAG: oligoendopeptidase, partial [Myxococcales bacterium]|nr:oligoendopeptidase [Myxococcales bacterium]
EETFSACLNHINGYRQTLYSRRGIDELELPCHNNRISRHSLETMFSVIRDFRPVLSRYLAAKAKHLGLAQLSHYDLNVSLGKSSKRTSYADAAKFVLEQFSGFSNELADFAKLAFERRWIEAEDRKGKAQGGFCAPAPKSKESRVFLTFGGNARSTQTLAHELGHAYHNWVLRHEAPFNRSFPSTLAETASTFAESVVREGALAACKSDDERIGLLDRKLSDATSMLMNIPARFHFERAMYAARKERELTPAKLSELVVEAFDDAYNGQLESHDAMFWASKMHFYLSDWPFYNFPYVVGFLFSLGLYERAREVGPDFSAQYDAFLRLTGSRTCEEVALESLGVDITKPDFWQSAMAGVERDVEAFEALI